MSLALRVSGHHCEIALVLRLSWPFLNLIIDQISRQKSQDKSTPPNHMIFYNRSYHEDDDVHVNFIMMGRLAQMA